ncbi:DUF2778 domain-containing protein [Burkholderia latens]|uniref:DUF2778 domain-containing protein n=1 Tax=Burkholderia latens TaxID=488446 RepID=A0A6H9SLC6_9BURK|nr:DUF2778 domain-containing protein [Burkholderia latens]KAB0632939.1 DUF2778 domain-containing protein [Burkholderia latens]VWB53528.1 miscellaneous; unknown [Burkholderia latens]
MQISFKLNGLPLSELTHGAQKMPAFSGHGIYRNKQQYQCVVKNGPIPQGTYCIVERQSSLSDIPHLFRGVNKFEWFALYAKDRKIDDELFCSQVRRGQFRLHPRGPPGISEGCMTVENRSDFLALRRTILNAHKFRTAGTSYDAYGTVVVS